MTADQIAALIPPEVVEAAAKAYEAAWEADEVGDPDDWFRAAIAAALAAWPRMTQNPAVEQYGVLQRPFLILPLPQEARDEPQTDRQYNVAERLFGDD